MQTELGNIKASNPQTEDIPPTDNLEQKAKEGKHKRHQNFQSSLNCIVILSLWAIFFSVLSCGAVYLWHMLTPESKHFLTQTQLEQIRTFVVTAILFDNSPLFSYYPNSTFNFLGAKNV